MNRPQENPIEMPAIKVSDSDTEDATITDREVRYLYLVIYPHNVHTMMFYASV